jgi:hypothetical protein
MGWDEPIDGLIAADLVVIRFLRLNLIDILIFFACQLFFCFSHTPQLIWWAI